MINRLLLHLRITKYKEIYEIHINRYTGMLVHWYSRYTGTLVYACATSYITSYIYKPLTFIIPNL